MNVGRRASSPLDSRLFKKQNICCTAEVNAGYNGLLPSACMMHPPRTHDGTTRHYHHQQQLQLGRRSIERWAGGMITGEVILHKLSDGRKIQVCTSSTYGTWERNSNQGKGGIIKGYY